MVGSPAPFYHTQHTHTHTPSIQSYNDTPVPFCVCLSVVIIFMRQTLTNNSSCIRVLYFIFFLFTKERKRVYVYLNRKQGPLSLHVVYSKRKLTKAFSFSERFFSSFSSPFLLSLYIVLFDRSGSKKNIHFFFFKGERERWEMRLHLSRRKNARFFFV